MNLGTAYPCILCLSQEPSMMLKLDCKGRPYASCTTCGARIFVRHKMALRGFSVLWGPLHSVLVVGQGELGKALISEAAKGTDNVNATTG